MHDDLTLPRRPLCTFWIPGRPVPKARPRMTKNGFAFTPKETRAYGELVARHAEACVRIEPDLLPIDAPVALEIVARLPRPKKPKYFIPAVTPDWDNLEKAVADGISRVRKERGLWRDDCLVCDATFRKRYARAPEEVGVSVAIYELLEP